MAGPALHPERAKQGLQEQNELVAQMTGGRAKRPQLPLHGRGARRVMQRMRNRRTTGEQRKYNGTTTGIQPNYNGPSGWWLAILALSSRWCQRQPSRATGEFSRVRTNVVASIPPWPAQRLE